MTITLDKANTVSLNEAPSTSGYMSSVHTFSLHYQTVVPAKPTLNEYENALMSDGASHDFAQLFAERITDTDAEYEIIGG